MCEWLRIPTTGFSRRFFQYKVYQLYVCRFYCLEYWICSSLTRFFIKVIIIIGKLSKIKKFNYQKKKKTKWNEIVLKNVGCANQRYSYYVLQVQTINLNIHIYNNHIGNNCQKYIKKLFWMWIALKSITTYDDISPSDFDESFRVQWLVKVTICRYYWPKI